ncbi:ribosome maturation factor RimM [Spiroplasma endosymbiont of Labia minor]|uniref:ribosome maturation factor RimM n=1 Tax=Spiroplasma endosymbiont of Labia minor TaxID=3066305 RepID=UPI0030CD6AF4
MNFNELNLIKIGKLVSTFGIKGQIKFKLNSDLQLINNLVGNTLFLAKDENEIIPVVVKNEKEQGNLIVLNFDNFNNINDIEKFINSAVYVKKDTSLVEEIGKNYIDYEVIYNRQILGKVTGFLDNGHYITVQIFIKEKQLYIPIVDEYVKSINNEQHLINAINLDRLMF